ELKVVQQLEELAFVFLRDQAIKTDPDYATVFRDIGIDVDELPAEEAGKRIRSHLIWKSLTEGLDRWAGIRHEIAALENFKGDGYRKKQRLFQVARAADAHEL